MAIELNTFASGDIDYISKMNANVAALEAAINALQQQAAAGGGAGSALSAGFFLDALFNHKDALIGVNSYKPTQGATGLTVAAGAVYLADVQTVVQSFASATLNFTGAVPGFYYIVIDSSGFPTRRDTLVAGTVYQVDWRGNGFYGAPVLQAPIFYDTAEAEGSRNSAVKGTRYPTLDGRLEYVEAVAKEANQDANQALSVAYELQAAIGGVSYRKIGCTVDGTTGIKGAIQIDFEGTIIGWSVIADKVGSLSVEVSRKASNQPPNAPQIPNTTTDKITASAPIILANAQSAAVADAGVSTWLRDVERWDVIQFNVISVNLITRATLYLQIFEFLPSPPDVVQPLPVWDGFFDEPLPPRGLPELPDSPPDFLESPPEGGEF
jgi:hypothetical protein